MTEFRTKATMVVSMERWMGKVAIVTGASSGIGAAIVESLVKQGLKVVGLARRLDRMEQLRIELASERGEFFAMKCDMSNESDILSAFEWTSNHLGPVHILVNNAGIIRNGPLIGGDSDQWRQVFDVNVIGLCIATDQACRIMRENDVDGHVIHVNSISGHYVPAVPNTNVYPASKHAVTAVSESLRKECNSLQSKIKVTSVSPGIVATEIFEVGNLNVNEIDKLPSLKSEDVADAVIYILSTPPNVLISELTIRPMGEPL